VTSKTAQRTLVNASLVIGGSTSLFCLAGIATSLFFHHYLPQQVVTVPIHLQYGYAIALQRVLATTDLSFPAVLQFIHLEWLRLAVQC